MELGAMICTPQRMSCGICPVEDFCLASLRGLQETLPITEKKRPIPHKQMTAAIIGDGKGRLLIVQRPANGLLGGLWKFPGGITASDESLQEALIRTTREELGVVIGVRERITSIKHAYTHFRISLHAFNCSLKSGRPRALGCKQWQWTGPHHLYKFPFSRAERKVMENGILQG